MMNGGQQIVGGLLAYCFTLIDSPPSPLKSWQAIFLTYGCFSVLWGLFVLWWLPGEYYHHFKLKNNETLSNLIQTAPCAQNVSRKKTKH